MVEWLVPTSLFLFLAIVGGCYFVLRKRLAVPFKWCLVISLSGMAAIGLMIWGLSYTGNIYALVFPSLVPLAAWLAFSVVWFNRWLKRNR